MDASDTPPTEAHARSVVVTGEGAQAPCDHDASAFALIEARIFARHGCTASTCHGERAAGSLPLTAGEAYGALVDVPARASSLKRVEPGRPDDSFLYRKLEAASAPDSVLVEGSPMPVGAPPLAPRELAAVRAWIAAGAPDVGREAHALRAQVASLVGACDAEPDAPGVDDATLAAPPPDLGVQLRMPPYVALPHSEWEGCFATYYDLTTTVPARFQGAQGRAFHVRSTEMHQSMGSHHLTIMPTALGRERVHDPAFGAWTCKGGPRAGAACEPLDGTSCGTDGVCGSAPKEGVACGGFGPFGSFVDPSSFGLGKSPKPYLTIEPIDGVYRDVALRGIVYWNLHAYNLTDRERVQTGELNLWYTDDTRYPERTLTLTTPSFHGIPPFTKRDVCGTWRAPRDVTLIRLSSHTHRHGERFWITDPSGQLIYESLDYQNSRNLVLDPPRVIDAADPARRTFTYCATFNNGVRADGSPDPGRVTRRSRIPAYAVTSCTPTACAAGKVGAPCRGVSDHASCDTASGSGDGLCDACPIVSGESTEHEMFVMHPDFVPAVLR